MAPCLALTLYAVVALYAVPLRSGLGGGGASGVSEPTFLFFAGLRLCVAGEQ